VTLCVKCGRFVDTPGSSALLLNALRDPLHGFPHANPYDDQRSPAIRSAGPQRSAAKIGETMRYQSEAALGKAFQQTVGVTPCRYRRLPYYSGAGSATN
jgi:AraC-like DNA-binding protein